MALVRTNQGSWTSTSTYGTGSYTTGSFTPPANSLLLVIIERLGNNTTGDLGQASCSGGSLSWTFLGSARGEANWSSRTDAHYAEVGGSPSSMTLTVDDAYNIYQWNVVCVAYTGYDTATPIAGYVTSGSTDIGDGSETQTLAATPTANDVSLYALFIDCGSIANPTMASGWTELYESGEADSGEVVLAERTGSTSTSVTCDDTYTGAFNYYKAGMFSWIVKVATSTTITGSITANGSIEQVRTSSITANATLEQSTTGSVTANAAIEQSSSGSITANSVVEQVRTSPIAANACIESTTSGALTVDLVIKAEILSSITVDATILAPAGSITVDAYISNIAPATWVSPPNMATMSDTPVLVFTMPTPNASQAMHFKIDLDTASTYDTASLRVYASNRDQTSWEYYNGSIWDAIAASGVASLYGGNNARFTVASPLSENTWYRQVWVGLMP